MNEEFQAIVQAAYALASRLPYTIVMTIADVLVRGQVSAWPEKQTALLHHLPTADFRDAAADFLESIALYDMSYGCWQRGGARSQPSLLCLAAI